MKVQENQRKIYHYFHNSASDATLGEIHDKKLVFQIPSLLDPNHKNECDFYFDPRDKRTLVFFDGHIPWGGLPKNSGVEMWGKTLISVPIKNIRKQRLEEEGPSQNLDSLFPDQEKKTMNLWIRRYLLLLHKSRVVVRKYRANSLSPIYVMIDVNEKGVTFLY